MEDESALQRALAIARGIQTDLSVAFPRGAWVESTPPEDPTGPTVFVTWAHTHGSWDSKRTSAWQESLATFASTLRQSFGIDAEIDLFHLHESIDWTRYGPRAIIDCDRVLIVLSKAWAERWEGTNDPGEGAGAAREADALHGLFGRDQQAWQAKLLVVLLPDADLEDLPADLTRVAFVSVDPSDLDSYEDLLRNLTGQPHYSKPPLGSIPHLPPLNGAANLAVLRAQLAEVRRAEKQVAGDATPEGVSRRTTIRVRESALRGFIEASLQNDN